LDRYFETAAAPSVRPDDVVVDLLLGAWRARQAAREAAAQLGIELPPGHDRAASIISAGVDREARGEPTVLTAFDDARRVAAALSPGAEVVVLLPRFGLPLRDENDWFLRFLARQGATVRRTGAGEGLSAGLAGRRASGDDATLRSLLRFFPGLVANAFAERIGLDPNGAGLIAQTGGLWLIPPDCRDADPAGASAEIDRLARLDVADAGLMAFVQSFGGNLFIDPPRLAVVADQAFRDGSSEVALALLARARSGARSTVAAAEVDLAAFGISIFEHQFDAVAAAPDPSSRVPDELRRQILELRDWARIMTGGALDDAATAGDPETADPARRLYQLNIRALARFKAGDRDGAMALEQEIAAALDQRVVEDDRLAFINAINLARLYRAMGDWSRYTQQVDRAFATSDGVRSESETIQREVMRAAVPDAQAPGAGRAAWLRACLTWLALSPPEALGVRAARAILGSAAGDRCDLPERVTTALLAKLRAAWPDLSAGDGPVPVFVGADTAAVKPAGLIGGLGAALLWSSDSAPLRVASSDDELLSRLTLAAFAEIAGVPLPEANSWIVDHNLGEGIPETVADAVALGWRHSVRSAVFAGGDFAHLWRSGAIPAATAALSPAVALVAPVESGVEVAFRRHRSPVLLFGPAAALALMCAAGPQPLAAIATEAGLGLADVLAVLRQLESDRVVRLVPETG